MHFTESITGMLVGLINLPVGIIVGNCYLYSFVGI